MRPGNPIGAFLAAWEPCYRHPARRSRGSCQACGRAYCGSCLFPEHHCAALTSRQAHRHPMILWLTAGTGLFILGVAAGVGLSPSQGSGPGNVAVIPTAARNSPENRGVNLQPATAPVLRSTPEHPVASRAETVALPPANEDLSTVPARVTREFTTPALGHETDFSPRASSFNRGPLERRALLLTFDAGSRSDGAVEILDTLAAAGVRTTFFLTGEFIRDHPGLVLRLDADGHEVGNHTETHLHLTRWEEIRRHETRADVDRHRLAGELARTNAAFRAITGHDMAPIWRSPYGEYNGEILDWAAAEGWRHVGWTASMDTLDWVADPSSHLYRTADEIARRVLTFSERDTHGARGAIVLMHLGSGRPASEQVGRVLSRILTGYRARGFEFLTASDMMRGSS
ncbi:MAG: polysaccharide deacetylase family protein [Acidobacteria bacterium]|nr:MAG: polysaccharide deacetylase family protein [Acidobacteriota bacterium]